MGSIMCIGVSLANSVMMVSFICPRLAQRQKYLRGRLVAAPGTLAADFDDRLRHDRRHGADGAGAGTRHRNAGAAGPRGDRRAWLSRHLLRCSSCRRCLRLLMGNQPAKSLSMHPDDPEKCALRFSSQRQPKHGNPLSLPIGVDRFRSSKLQFIMTPAENPPGCFLPSPQCPACCRLLRAGPRFRAER